MRSVLKQLKWIFRLQAESHRILANPSDFCDPLDRIGAKSSTFDLLLTVKKEIWWKLKKYMCFFKTKTAFKAHLQQDLHDWQQRGCFFRRKGIWPAKYCQMIYIYTYFFLSCKNVCHCRTSQLCISSNSLLANDFLLENWGGAFFNANFRILKWRYCKYKTIFCGDIPLHRPYISLIYGRYLQSIGSWNGHLFINREDQHSETLSKATGRVTK